MRISDDEFCFEDNWFLDPQTCELVPRSIAEAYGLHLDEDAYRQWRHERYLQYSNYQETDAVIPPPWDFRNCRLLFKIQRQQRQNVFKIYKRCGQLVGTAPLNPFDLKARDEQEQAEMERWFLRCETPELPSIVPAVAVTSSVRQVEDEHGHPKASPMKRRRVATSDGITEPQFANVYNAIAFSNHQGFKMNLHVVVTWSMVGMVHDVQVREAQKKLLELIRKFLRKTLGLPALWVWVLEKSGKRGLHSHILLHVPKKHLGRFEKMLATAVKTVTGKTPLTTEESSTIYVRHEDDFKSQWTWFLYFMKGLALDFEALEPWQEEFVDAYVKIRGRPPTPQGQFDGQRTGTSQPVAQAARQAAGFASQWDRGYRTSNDLYVSNYHEMRELDHLMATINHYDPMPYVHVTKPVFR